MNHEKMTVWNLSSPISKGLRMNQSIIFFYITTSES